MISTTFQGIETNDYYRGLKDYPKFILKLNSLIKEVGISKVINKYCNVPDEELFFEDLTMLIRSKVSNTREKRYPTDARHYLYDGFNNVGDYYYVPTLNHKEIKVNIKDSLGTNISLVAGYYIPSRNLIIISVPLFDYKWSEDMDKPLLILSEMIEVLKKFKIAKVDISKEIETSRMKAFMNVIKGKIINIRNTIEDNQISLDDYNRNIITLSKEINYNNKLVKSLIALEKQDTNLITDQIIKLKKVPFVKEVVLTNDGIAVYIGEVTLKHNKIDHIMGRFRIYIKPDEVRIFNFDAIKSSDEWYDHPHISKSKPCLNTWAKKVNDLLSKMDFVNLVIFLKLYLQSYCESDEGHPYIKLEIWDEFRTKQTLHLNDKIPEIGQEREYVETIRKEEIKDGTE